MAEEAQQSSMLADGTLTRPKTNKRVSINLCSFHHTNACGRSMCRTVRRRRKTIQSYCFFTRFRTSASPQIVFLFWFPSGTDLKCGVMMYRRLQRRAQVFSWQLSVSLTPNHLPSFLLTWSECTFTRLGFIHMHLSALTASRFFSPCVSAVFITYWRHFWHKRWIYWNQLSSWGPKTNRYVVGVQTAVWVEVRSGLKLGCLHMVQLQFGFRLYTVNENLFNIFTMTDALLFHRVYLCVCASSDSDNYSKSSLCYLY